MKLRAGSSCVVGALVLAGCQGAPVPVGMGLGALQEPAAPGYEVLNVSGCAGRNYAVFARSSVQEASITGGSNIVRGDLHTNHQLRMAGNQDSVAGTAETVKGVITSGKTETVSATVISKAAAFPYAPQVAGLKPTFSFTGNVDLNSRPEVWSAKGVLKPGVYYATGKLSLSGKGVTGTVTLEGSSVDLACESANLHPYAAGILAYAFGGNAAINVSGSSNYYEGVVYGPSAGFQLTGSRNTLMGAVLVDTVKIAGNSNTVGYRDVPGVCTAPTPTPKPTPTPTPKPTPTPTPKPTPTPTPKPTPTPACWPVGDKPLKDHNRFWSIWDPHEHSGDGADWGNQEYGEVELLHSANNDLVMQVTQGAEKFGRWNGYTVNHKLALRDKTDVLVYDGLSGKMTINGKPQGLQPNGPAIALPCGGRVWVGLWGFTVQTSKCDVIQVDQLVNRKSELFYGLPNGEYLADFVNIQGYLGTRKCGEVRGGLGSFDGDGDPSNDLKGRCGSAAVADPTKEDSLPRFFREWRVPADQSLFK